MLNTAVKDYQDNRVIFGDGTSILSGNLIWTSGVKSEAVEGIGNSETERRGRILTDRYNRVQGFDNIFAIGRYRHYRRSAISRRLSPIGPRSHFTGRTDRS